MTCELYSRAQKLVPAGPWTDDQYVSVYERNTAAEAVVKWATKYAKAPSDSDAYYREQLLEAVAALDQQGRGKDG